MQCSNPFMRVDSTLKPLSYLKKRRITQNFKYAFPCGQCLNCRINQSRLWANRIVLEQKASRHSYFVTLTYDDEHLPYNDYNEPILVKSHLQKYIKRIRKGHHAKLRYFAVGEYGSHTWRPHYHLTIFTQSDFSENLLEKKWADSEGNPLGFSFVGDVSPQSANYIAGYIKKKALPSYRDELGIRPPEFSTMSKQNGGIGLSTVKAVANIYKDHEKIPNNVVNSVSIGHKKKALGRYLTKKMAEELGQETKIVEDYYALQFDLDQLFDMEDPDYYHKMLDHFKGKRDSSLNKTNLKSAKRSL